MSWERGLTKDGRPSKRRAEGPAEPVISGRAPAPVIALLLAKAADRKISKSAIVREALCRYVEECAA